MGLVSLLALGMIALTVWVGARAIFAGAAATVPTLVAQVPTVVLPSPAPTWPPATVVSRPAVTPTPRQAATDEVELVRLTEAELTVAIREALAESPDGSLLEGASARLTPGRVTVTGSYRGLMVPIPITVVGRPEVRDRQPSIRVESVEGAGMELPEAVRDTINMMLQAENVIPTPGGTEITRIDLLEGELAVFGRR